MKLNDILSNPLISILISSNVLCPELSQVNENNFTLIFFASFPSSLKCKMFLINIKESKVISLWLNWSLQQTLKSRVLILNHKCDCWYDIFCRLCFQVRINKPPIDTELVHSQHKAGSWLLIKGIDSHI